LIFVFSISMNTVENLPPPPPIPPPQLFVPDNTLHTLVNENKKGKLKSVLNKGGIIVDVLDLNNCTALYYACLTGNKDCVKILLNHNASPNE
jgi:ankyrin repeat protein